MGLCLNYELRLPGGMTETEVAAHLEALRQAALSLPLREISPLVRARDAELPEARWELPLRLFASTIAKPWDEDSPPLTGDVASAQGFLINPGEGCETAVFGLLHRADDAGGHAEWFWQAWCKTQYASIVSDAHFVACHVALVQLLDQAIALGIDVVVRDEGHFWETRDEGRLIAEVRTMNRLVAAFAGKLSDAMNDAHELRAAIFDHPRFERLEMGEEEESS